MYRYVKAPPGYTLKKSRSLGQNLRTILSAVFLTTGIATFTTVAYPLISYELKYAPRLTVHNLLSPAVDPSAELGVVPAARAQEPTFLPEMINTTLDYTDASVWFRSSSQKNNVATTARLYTLSIDSLGIANATVRSDHTDLKKTLIHYPGTASPGELGNTVIFGHSVLPQFFDPQNYVSIFSTLHTLEVGEDILISDEGALYTYKIYDMYEVTPDDLSPLAQTYDRRRLTLITCTPPGTYLRRLIIKAELQDI